jgi:peptidoglycan hydrolase CwlO-like protein
MKKLIQDLEKSLNEVSKERTRLESKLNKIGFTVGDNEAKETILKGEINSKLFLLGAISGELKNNIEEYKDLLEKYNLIKL